MEMVFALAGNPNSGKTTLFNALTGSNQHVGNFPGVTVEKKTGMLKGHREISIADLPGIYSLSPYTAEEEVTRDFILRERPDGILNIVDATNIERNLYLSLQLMELGRPMVIALNMMDEIRAGGGTINVKKLEEILGIPVIPISASKKEGIGELTACLTQTAVHRAVPADFYSGELRKALFCVERVVKAQAAEHNYPLRFAAVKLIEGDASALKMLELGREQQYIIEDIVQNMEERLGMDREEALADMRYAYIEKVCGRCVVKGQETKQQLRSERIDRILTHRILAIPLFLLIMLTVFWLTFSVLGAPLQTLLENGLGRITNQLDAWLKNAGTAPVVRSLIIDGICAGVGSVLSFLPIIIILFFFLSILEDSGYMARAAFIMDQLLRKIGLSGRSFVPMLIGFGCSVPAIMAARTLPSDRDRRLTIILIPFMSCSAKLPIYGMITAAFFPRHGALIMLCMYLLGILTAVLSAFLLKNTVYRGDPAPFVMELPAYRRPAAGSVLLHMWERARDFIRKAFTVIFMAAIVIWFLQRLDWSLQLTQNSSESMLASIGRLIAPAFKPLGFSDWRACAALISGFTAKEAVVSTFTILTGAAGKEELVAALTAVFPCRAQALSFLAFTILYMPCVAAFAAAKRELGSWRSAVMAAAFQTAMAYGAAVLVYFAARLFI